MAYSTSNPPQLLVPSVGGGSALWAYKSTHTSTETVATGFITNGHALGMKLGDLCLVINTTSAVPYPCGVGTVTASSAATLVASTL